MPRLPWLWDTMECRDLPVADKHGVIRRINLTFRHERWLGRCTLTIGGAEGFDALDVRFGPFPRMTGNRAAARSNRAITAPGSGSGGRRTRRKSFPSRSRFFDRRARRPPCRGPVLRKRIKSYHDEIKSLSESHSVYHIFVRTYRYSWYIYSPYGPLRRRRTRRAGIATEPNHQPK